MSHFCDHCGVQLLQDENFCRRCGRDLGKPSKSRIKEFPSASSPTSHEPSEPENLQGPINSIPNRSKSEAPAKSRALKFDADELNNKDSRKTTAKGHHQVCPKCGYQGKVPDDNSAPKIRCPKCGTIYSKFVNIYKHIKPVIQTSHESPTGPNAPSNEKEITRTNPRRAKFTLAMVAVCLLIIASYFGINTILTYHSKQVLDDGVAAYDRQDYFEALRLLKPLAGQGNMRAQYLVANIYYNGQLVPKDYTEAGKWFYKAADQGHAQAQYTVGMMYANGQGVPKDDNEAVKYYRKAADQGYAKSQLVLGAMYAEGRGVPKDYNETARWFRKAADQGDAQAQLGLGLLYANGQGVQKDYAEASKWFRKAADQGDAQAQFGLGLLYANGQGVPKDYAEAGKWFHKAADQGHAQAQDRLGIMNHDSQQSPKDDSVAVKWDHKEAPSVTHHPKSDGDQVVQAPALSVGDEFVLEHNNLTNPKLSYVGERKVISLNGDRMQVSVRNLKSNYSRTLDYDRQWNLIAARGSAGEGSDYSPAVKYYDFPLYPGKRWSARCTEQNIKTGQLREHKIVAEVGGWELVTVPAGTFRAIKVLIRSEVKDIQTGEVKSGSDISWYAPDAKRSVKSELKTLEAKDGQDDVQIAQLVKYKVAQLQKSSIPSNIQKSESRIPERVIDGILSRYECGDNCYLTITDNKGKEYTGLCVASPICDEWNQEGIMPKSFKDKIVRVTLGEGIQLDGSGNKINTMDAFTTIELLK